MAPDMDSLRYYILHVILPLLSGMVWYSMAPDMDSWRSHLKVSWRDLNYYIPWSLTQRVNGWASL